MSCEVLSELPPQTDRFFGREAQLSSMTQLLEEADDRKGAVLCGISGSGKTQLAREYVSREQDRFSSILWINADSIQTIEHSFSQCADRIRLRFSQMLQASAHVTPQSMVLEWIRVTRSQRWLVVVDGLDDLAIARSLIQSFSQLLSKSGAICITSTNPKIAKAWRLTQILVERLDIGPACSLVLWRALGTTAPQDDKGKFHPIIYSIDGIWKRRIITKTSLAQTWAREVAKILNRYALGLELAGILVHEGIVQLDMPPTIFESKYKQLTTIDPVVWNWERPHTLFDIFDALHDDLVAKDATCGHLLTLCSIYGPQEISIDFLQQLVFEMNDVPAGADTPWKGLQELLADDLSLNLAVSKLHEIFLAHKKHAADQSMLSFSLHGSICQWRLATLGDQRPQWIVQSLTALAGFIRRETDRLQSVSLHTLVI